MNSKIKALVNTLLCVILWALLPVVSKLGQTNLDNHQFLFWSSLVSFLIFFGIILPQKKIETIAKFSVKDWANSIFLGFLGSYLYYILLYFGYANAQGIEVLIIQFCWPIFVIFLSIFILREKINSRKVMSVIIGFFGVFLVLSKGNFGNVHLENLFVDGIVLFAAFVFGLFSVLSKRVKTDSLSLVTIYFLSATIFSFFPMILFSDFKLPTRETIMSILLNGALVNGISYIFWIEALKNGKASFIAPFFFLTPVISTILLILLFKEPFHLIYLFGMSSVILGGLLNKE